MDKALAPCGKDYLRGRPEVTRYVRLRRGIRSVRGNRRLHEGTMTGDRVRLEGKRAAMHFLAPMQVRTKLFTGFGLVCGLLIVVVAVTMSSVRSTRGFTDRVIVLRAPTTKLGVKLLKRSQRVSDSPAKRRPPWQGGVRDCEGSDLGAASRPGFGASGRLVQTMGRASGLSVTANQ
ncbi:hypothetical protein NKDENANG_02916 [Candidatus Entotheonellaceae bacterium PAL068K]